MESGYLAAESFLAGAKWATKKGRLGARGPTLVDPDGLGMVYLEGFRCQGCKALFLHY